MNSKSEKRNIYDTIMNLPEKGNIEKVISKWKMVAERRSWECVPMPIIIPDMLIYSAAGIGKSHLLGLLVSYLHKEKVMDFLGEQPFFEFRLEYCHPHESFKELQRFHEQIKCAAGFRNQYKGVIGIELDEWLGHYDEKYFKVFMEYLEENSDEWLLIFSIESDDEEERQKMYQFLAMYFRLELVELELPSVEAYTSYVCAGINKYGFDIEEKDIKTLQESISILRESRYFDGYKSMNRLIQDIVYEAYIGDSYEESKVDENVIALFDSQSEYIQRMKANYEVKMGFAYN